MKFDMNKYEDFIGTLVKKKNLFFNPNLIYLYLRNEKKQIKVIFGRRGGDHYIVGQKMRIGHMGKRVTSIRPLSHSPYSRVLNRESYPCGLYGREVCTGECSDVQNIIRKPGEVEEILFDIDKALSLCPKCPYNQHR